MPVSTPLQHACRVIDGFRRASAAALADEPCPAARLFRAAWEEYRPNIPHSDWTGEVEATPDELESVHWFLFFTAFLSAWWQLQGERRRREGLRGQCVTVLGRVGWEEDELRYQIDLLEDIFGLSLRELRLPPGSLKRLCELFEH